MLAPHRKVLAQPFDRLPERGRPGLGPNAARPPALRRLSPSDRGSSEKRRPPAPRARRSVHRSWRAASARRRHAFSPLRYREASRREGAARPFPIISPDRPKTCIGGLLRLVDSQLSASETRLSFSIAPSHMWPNPHSRVLRGRLFAVRLPPQTIPARRLAPYRRRLVRASSTISSPRPLRIALII